MVARAAFDTSVSLWPTAVLPQGRLMAYRRAAHWNRCRRVRNSIFDVLDFEIHAIANMGAVAAAGGQELASFFGALRFDAPLLDSRHVDGRVIELHHLRFLL
jgi:hypothetical protein